MSSNKSPAAAPDTKYEASDKSAEERRVGQ
ncbi:hypothetical protein Tco_0870092, partial [Tanacetum coccineum]